MLDDAAAIAAVFADTMLTGREVVELAPGWRETQPSFAIRCDADEVLFVWHTARSSLAATGRWPVVSLSWEGGYADGDWLSHMEAERARAFEDRVHWPPAQRALMEAPFELPDFSEVLAERARLWFPEGDLEEWRLDWHLRETVRAFGSAPTSDDVRVALGDRASEASLDRWLLGWEAARVVQGAPFPTAYDGHLSPFVPTGAECAVFLLPTRFAWDAFRSLGFFGMDRPERLAAVVRSWQERFGAELMANWDTMLEFVVTRPPATLEDAWQVAYEQVLVAPGTIRAPVVALRRHAQALVGRPGWFLHERP